MSIYLKDSSVLLDDSGNVATDEMCCCDNTGACCADDGTCTIESEADCTMAGGTYQGNGTVCDPNPCPLPECACGFAAFDLSGRQFLRYNRTISAISNRHEFNNCDPPDDQDNTVDADGSATFEQHYEGCSLITDVNTSASSHTVKFNGIVTSSCSLATMECFCNVVIPDHNQCTTFIPGFQTCANCDGGDCGSDSTSTTATTRTRTVIFCVNCTAACFSCVGCTDTCNITGSYVVTETLSEECTPI